MPTIKVKDNGIWKSIDMVNSIHAYNADRDGDGNIITSTYVKSQNSREIFTQSTEPSTAINNDIWIDTANNTIKLKLSNSWISIGGGGTVPTNISAFVNDVGYITGISSSDVTTALGYTPYNSTNPNGYTSNVGTVTGVKMNGTTKNPTSGIVDIGTVLTSYTETDPTVPAWAKQSTKPSYTFSEIGSTPTTLSGYGITDASISNGTITLGSNSITPLTSFTETDPVFSASVAAEITSTDITNWNNKSELYEVTLTTNWSTSPVTYSINKTINEVYEAIVAGKYVQIVDAEQQLVYELYYKPYVEEENGVITYINIGFVFTSAVNIATLYLTYENSNDSVEMSYKYLAKNYNGTLSRVNSDRFSIYLPNSDRPESGELIVCFCNTASTSDSPQIKFSSYGTTDSTYYPVWYNGVVTSATNKFEWDNGEVLVFAFRSERLEFVSKSKVSVPTKTSDLTNDSGYIASDEIGKVYVSDTEPSSSNNYDIWIDTSSNLINANGVMV